MVIKYKTPKWHYGIVFAVTIFIYFIPSAYLVHHPEKAYLLTKPYFIAPLLLFLFCFLKLNKKNASPNYIHPNTNSPKNKSKKIFTFVLFMILTEMFLFLFSITTSNSFANLSHSINKTITLSPNLNPYNLWTWFSLWCFFALYTAANHYFYHTEKIAPALCMGIFNFKNNLCNNLVKRAAAYFSLGANLFLIYTSLAFLLLISLYISNDYQTINIGFNNNMFLSLFILSIIPNFLNIALVKKYSEKFKIKRAIYFILPAFIIALFAFTKLNSIETPEILAQNPLFLALQQNTPKPPSKELLHLVTYAFFVLATPLISSLIIKNSARFSTRFLLLSLICFPFFIITALALLSITSIPPISFCITLSTALSLTAILNILFIIIFSLKKDTTGLLLGVVEFPKKNRTILAGNNFNLLSAHVLTPGLLAFIFISFGYINLISVAILTSTVIFVFNFINLCSIFGRIKRLEHAGLSDKPLV